MNKKTFLSAKSIFMFIVVTLFFISFALNVEGTCDQYSGSLEAYYSFDTDEDDDTANGNDGTNNGVDFSNSAKINNGGDFELGDSDYIDYGAGTILDNGLFPHTICYWMKPESSLADGGYMVMNLYRQSTQWYNIYSRAGATYYFRFGFRGTNTGKTWTISDWVGTEKHICMVYNGGTKTTVGNFDLYIDGALYTTGKANENVGGSGLNNFHGKDNGASGYFDGWIDEFALFLETGNSTLATDLYNSGSGCNPLATIDTISLNDDFVNNTINYNDLNLTIGYNASIVGDSELYNCSFYNGTNLLTSEDDVNLSSNNDWTYNFSTNVEEEYYFNFNCSNINAEDSNGWYTYKIDTFQPRITSNFENNSQVYTGNTITFNVTFTDNNLFAFNITWLDNDGTVNQRFFRENITESEINNITTYIESVASNSSIVAEAWDSHTANSVRPLAYTISDKLIKFEGLRIEGNFKYMNKNNELQTYFYLDDDRYKLKMTFEEDDYFHYLNLSKHSDLKYLPDSKYLGHFVHWSTKRWIDFENSNIEYLEVKDIGSKYEIKIKLIERSDEIEFESVGDLNYNSVTYFYEALVEPSEEVTLLEQIRDAINTFGNNITEVLVMILWIFFIIAMLVLGITKDGLFMGLGSVGWVLILFYLIDNVTTWTTYYLILGLLSILMTIMFPIIGYLLHMRQKKKVVDRGLKRIY